MPWAILYIADGELYNCGPYESEAVAMQAAKDFQESGEFDINDQHVYKMGPNLRMVELSADDLI